MTTEAEIANRPIKLPMIEINTIGAGAGSIAWLDEALGLHVGPQSAGSDPGPVAYGKGGTEPTVADANLVLGRLMPKYFASGRIALDLKASRLAIEKKIAKPLQMTIEEAALGIIKIANANMERAVRLSSAEKGYDPRMITMVAFGGAGPMHAAALAKSAQVPQVLIPRQPGVFSAEGLVMSDVRHDFVQTHLLSGKDLSTDKLVKIFDNLETKGAKALEEDGFSLDKQIISRTADLRYYGQAYEINVPLSNGPINESTVDDLIKKFHELHQQFYAHNHLNKIVEFVSGRLVATGLMSVPKLQEVKISKTSNKSVCFKHDTCKIYFEEENSFVETPIYFRKDLSPGTKLEGPLIVVQTDTTIVVHPDQSLSVDSYANLIISTGAIQYES